MATPIGHAVAGGGIYFLGEREGRLDKAVLFACIVFSLAPDLDFIPGLLKGQPALYHNGVTHSLGAAMIAALIGAFVFRKRKYPFTILFLLFFGSYSSHLVLDMLGVDSRPPLGIPLLWPLSSEHFLSSVALLPGVRHAATTDATTAEWILGILSWHNLMAIGIELLLLTPILLVVYMMHFRKKPPPERKP